MDKISENLNRYIKPLLDETDLKKFSAFLCHYVDYILEAPEFVTIIADMKKQRMKYEKDSSQATGNNWLQKQHNRTVRETKHWEYLNRLLNFRKSFEAWENSLSLDEVCNKYGGQSSNQLVQEDAVDILHFTANLKKIMRGEKPDTPSHFDIEKLKIFASQVNNHILAELSKKEVEEKSKTFVANKNKQEKINKIELAIHKTNTDKLEVIVNETYQLPLEVRRGKYWTLLYKLAENQQVANNKSFFDYFNSNPNNPLISRLGYKKTKILKYDGAARLIPNISINLISGKQLSRRRNKTA